MFFIRFLMILVSIFAPGQTLHASIPTVLNIQGYIPEERDSISKGINDAFALVELPHAPNDQDKGSVFITNKTMNIAEFLNRSKMPVFNFNGTQSHMLPFYQDPTCIADFNWLTLEKSKEKTKIELFAGQQIHNAFQVCAKVCQQEYLPFTTPRPITNCQNNIQAHGGAVLFDLDPASYKHNIGCYCPPSIKPSGSDYPDIIGPHAHVLNTSVSHDLLRWTIKKQRNGGDFVTPKAYTLISIQEPEIPQYEHNPRKRLKVSHEIAHISSMCQQKCGLSKGQNQFENLKMPKAYIHNNQAVCMCPSNNGEGKILKSQAVFHQNKQSINLSPRGMEEPSHLNKTSNLIPAALIAHIKESENRQGFNYSPESYLKVNQPYWEKNSVDNLTMAYDNLNKKCAGVCPSGGTFQMYMHQEKLYCQCNGSSKANFDHAVYAKVGQVLKNPVPQTSGPKPIQTSLLSSIGASGQRVKHPNEPIVVDFQGRVQLHGRTSNRFSNDLQGESLEGYDEGQSRLSGYGQESHINAGSRSSYAGSRSSYAGSRTSINDLPASKRQSTGSISTEYLSAKDESRYSNFQTARDGQSSRLSIDSSMFDQFDQNGPLDQSMRAYSRRSTPTDNVRLTQGLMENTSASHSFVKKSSARPLTLASSVPEIAGQSRINHQTYDRLSQDSGQTVTAGSYAGYNHLSGQSTSSSLTSKSFVHENTRRSNLTKQSSSRLSDHTSVGIKVAGAFDEPNPDRFSETSASSSTTTAPYPKILKRIYEEEAKSQGQQYDQRSSRSTMGTLQSGHIQMTRPTTIASSGHHSSRALGARVNSAFYQETKDRFSGTRAPSSHSSVASSSHLTDRQSRMDHQAYNRVSQDSGQSVVAEPYAASNHLSNNSTQSAHTAYYIPAQGLIEKKRSSSRKTDLRPLTLSNSVSHHSIASSRTPKGSRNSLSNRFSSGVSSTQHSLPMDLSQRSAAFEGRKTYRPELRSPRLSEYSVVPARTAAMDDSLPRNTPAQADHTRPVTPGQATINFRKNQDQSMAFLEKKFLPTRAQSLQNAWAIDPMQQTMSIVNSFNQRIKDEVLRLAGNNTYFASIVNEMDLHNFPIPKGYGPNSEKGIIFLENKFLRNGEDNKFYSKSKAVKKACSNLCLDLNKEHNGMPAQQFFPFAVQPINNKKTLCYCMICKGSLINDTQAFTQIPKAFGAFRGVMATYFNRNHSWRWTNKSLK